MAGKQTPSVWELPGDDVAACVAFYEAKGRSISSDEMQVMMRLQSDPAELTAAAMHWNISEPPPGWAPRP